MCKTFLVKSTVCLKSLITLPLVYAQYTRRCSHPDNKAIKDENHEIKSVVLFSISPLFQKKSSQAIQREDKHRMLLKVKWEIKKIFTSWGKWYDRKDKTTWYKRLKNYTFKMVLMEIFSWFILPFSSLSVCAECSVH